MALHKYKLGQSLTFSPGRIGLEARRACKVVRLLPNDEAGQPQYRIKCVSEPVERVAKESALSQ